MMEKKAGITSFAVTVTTTGVNPIDHKEVYCDLGPPAIKNELHLSLNTEYYITFALVKPGAVPAVTNFDSKKPFTNQPKTCPPKLPGGAIQKPCSLTANNSESITIHVEAWPNKGVTAYRLNFNDPYSCDPIIIHE